MTDYIHVILSYPLYFYHFGVSVWGGVLALPWPSGRDWFRWFLFLVLGKLVWWLIGLFYSRKYSIRTSENGAAAIVASLFERH